VGVARNQFGAQRLFPNSLPPIRLKQPRTLGEYHSATEGTRLPPALQRIVDEAKHACAEVNNGEFASEWGNVQRIDLIGDLRSDWVLNDVAHQAS